MVNSVGNGKNIWVAASDGDLERVKVRHLAEGAQRAESSDYRLRVPELAQLPLRWMSSLRRPTKLCRLATLSVSGLLS